MYFGLMYEFHYDYIKNKYGSKSRILFTNTDSLMYEEKKTEDVYEDFSSDKEMFVFSNYSTKSKYYDNSNKLVVGKMEDETASVAIEEFVVLTLKRPGGGGGGLVGQFDHLCCFSKNVSSRESIKPWLFVTFDIIISRIFPENFIKIPPVVQKI